MSVGSQHPKRMRCHPRGDCICFETEQHMVLSPNSRSHWAWNQGVEAVCLTIKPKNSLIEFFLLILATLSSACLLFSVPRKELLPRGHPMTPGKELQSARPSARTYNREKKSMTDVSVKNPGTGQPLRGLTSGKYILGSYWKNFDSKFI